MGREKVMLHRHHTGGVEYEDPAQNHHASQQQLVWSVSNLPTNPVSYVLAMNVRSVCHKRKMSNFCKVVSTLCFVGSVSAGQSTSVVDGITSTGEQVGQYNSQLQAFIDSRFAKITPRLEEAFIL